MTNQITTISRERLEEISKFMGKMVLPPYHAEVQEIARALLAVMAAKPFGYLFTGPAGLVVSPVDWPCEGLILQGPIWATPPSPSAQDGWIKCSDRLPENGETVLCGCFFGGPNDFRIKTGGLFCGVLCIVGGSWEVTHWMPLPAAPGGE